MPPDKRNGPPAKKGRRQSTTSPESSITEQATEPKRRRCAFLHPTHLTGCKELVAHNRLFCGEHGGI